MHKALLIQLARFGDLVQSKRLIKSLLARGELHLCLDHSLVPLARLLYPQAITHGLDAHGTAGLKASSNPGSNTGATDKAEQNALPLSLLAGPDRASLDALAAHKFDLVYNLNHSGLNLALARLFPPDSIEGHYVQDGQALRSPWLDLAFRWTGQRLLAPLNLMDFWAYFCNEPIAPQAVNPPARAGGRGLGLVLAGRQARRSLPPETLAQCARIAFEACNGPPVFLFGGKSEQPLARALLRHFPGAMLEKTRNLSGKTDWAGLVEALEGLDCLLSPDTGVMHLAAHLGTPVQAFFLSSAWCFETGPYGAGHQVWQACTDCLPCLEAAPCTLDTQCLAPFGHRGFFAALSNALKQKQLAGQGEFAPYLLHLESVLDESGTTWKLLQGQDPHEAQRKALRAAVAEYLGTGPDSLPNNKLAALLYDERDWMRTLLDPASGRRRQA